MVRIRLRRTGARNRPYYRVVVADSRAPRDGRFLDILGHYDPLPNPPQVSLHKDKAQLWLRRGAQPTAAVARILKGEGLISSVAEVKDEG